MTYAIQNRGRRGGALSEASHEHKLLCESPNGLCYNFVTIRILFSAKLGTGLNFDARPLEARCCLAGPALVGFA
jgi:hypothetical protein